MLQLNSFFTLCIVCEPPHDYFFNIPTDVPIIYTLESTNSH